MKLKTEEIKRIFYQRINFNLNKNLFLNTIIGLLNFLRIKLRKKEKIIFEKKQILAIVTTKNQFNVLHNILNKNHKNTSIISSIKLNEFEYIDWKNLTKTKKTNYNINQKIKILFKHPHLLRDLYYLVFCEEILENIIIYLRNCKVEKLLYASDHGLITSYFIIAARYLNLKTYYIQHGMVTEKFPKLESNYFFSYGYFSSIAYENTNTKIIEVGKNYSKNDVKKTSQQKDNLIGISLNEFDDIKKLKNEIKKISSIYPTHKIIVKLHPSMNRNKFKHYNLFEGSLIEYFKIISFHLSCESSIHLDSIYYEKPSFYINLLSKKYNYNYDYYKFIKNNLIVDFYSIKNHLDYNNPKKISENYIENIFSKKNPSEIINKYLNV